MLVRSLGRPARFSGTTLDIRRSTDDFLALGEERFCKSVDTEQADGHDDSAAEPAERGGDRQTAAEVEVVKSSTEPKQPWLRRKDDCEAGAAA